MFTQPPFRYSQGSRAGQPVSNDPPTPAWSYFCSKADADKALAIVQALAGNGEATLINGTGFEGGYIPDGSNPDNVQVWIIQGYIDNGMGAQFNRDGTPRYSFDEFAGSLIDRMTKPQDGLDAYPLPPAVKLVYSASEQGLIWKAA